MRSGDSPVFWKYAFENVLIPTNGPLSEEVDRITRNGFKFFYIPVFQRQIVWDSTKFEELVQSSSNFLGHVTFCETRKDNFEHFQRRGEKIYSLIDGLQRFSVATTLLYHIYDLVLSESPKFPEKKPLFQSLSYISGAYFQVIGHNYRELQTHSRLVIKNSFRQFSSEMEVFLKSKLQEPGSAWADKICSLLVARQIAPDYFSGFENEAKAAITFIGLNTTKVQLDLVDQVRSMVIERGQNTGWNPEDCDKIESAFSDVFYNDKGEPEQFYRPFMGVIFDCLSSEIGRVPSEIFKSWETSLDKSEVIKFCEFIKKFEHIDNSFVKEIYNCGDIPRAAILLRYYAEFLQSGAHPSFLSNGIDENKDLWLFLKSLYRVYLSGPNKIGRTRDIIATGTLASDIAHSDKMKKLSNRLSNEFYQGINVTDKIPKEVIRSKLYDLDLRRCEKIFNAEILPLNADDVFVPLVFGKSTREGHYQVDHIIPKAQLDREKTKPGFREGNLIHNLLPWNAQWNRNHKDTPASTKFSPGGPYSNYLSSGLTIHPFVQYIQTHQQDLGEKLDNVEMLQLAHKESTAGPRIEWHVERLHSHI